MGVIVIDCAGNRAAELPERGERNDELLGSLRSEGSGESCQRRPDRQRRGESCRCCRLTLSLRGDAPRLPERGEEAAPGQPKSLGTDAFAALAA
jgi:hypothetical protein